MCITKLIIETPNANDMSMQVSDSAFPYLLKKNTTLKKYIKNPTIEDSWNPDIPHGLTTPLLNGLINIDRISPIINIISIVFILFFISRLINYGPT